MEQLSYMLRIQTFGSRDSFLLYRVQHPEWQLQNCCYTWIILKVQSFQQSLLLVLNLFEISHKHLLVLPFAALKITWSPPDLQATAHLHHSESKPPSSPASSDWHHRSHRRPRVFKKNSQKILVKKSKPSKECEKYPTMFWNRCITPSLPSATACYYNTWRCWVHWLAFPISCSFLLSPPVNGTNLLVFHSTIRIHRVS